MHLQSLAYTHVLCLSCIYAVKLACTLMRGEGEARVGCGQRPRKLSDSQSTTVPSAATAATAVSAMARPTRSRQKGTISTCVRHTRGAHVPEDLPDRYPSVAHWDEKTRCESWGLVLNRMGAGRCVWLARFQPTHLPARLATVGNPDDGAYHHHHAAADALDLARVVARIKQTKGSDDPALWKNIFLDVFLGPVPRIIFFGINFFCGKGQCWAPFVRGE